MSIRKHLSRRVSWRSQGRLWTVLATLGLLFVLTGCGNAGIFSGGGGNWQASSLRDQHVQTFAVNPGQLTHIYAGDASGDVFVSTDAGMTWHKSSSGLPVSGSISALSFDNAGKKLYAATSEGLFASSDAAQTWRVVAGVPAGAYTTLAFDINTPESIYVGSAHMGVFKSLNGGATWTPISKGLPAGQAITGLLYDSNLKQLWAAFSTALYRSDDGGGNWQVMDNGLPANAGIRALALGAITSGNGSLLFVGTDHGFFRSTDAGQHWVQSELSLARLHITAVLLDANSPATVYVSTSIGVLRSLDSGQTWDQLATGLPANQQYAGLVQGGVNYAQLFVAAGGIYFYPGSVGTFDVSHWLPILPVLLFFGLLYLFFIARKRPSRRSDVSAP